MHKAASMTTCGSGEQRAVTVLLAWKQGQHSGKEAHDAQSTAVQNTNTRLNLKRVSLQLRVDGCIKY